MHAYCYIRHTTYASLCIEHVIVSYIVYIYNSSVFVPYLSQYIWIQYTDNCKMKDLKIIKTLFYVFHSQIYSYIWLQKSGFHYTFKYLLDVIDHSD